MVPFMTVGCEYCFICF